MQLPPCDHGQAQGKDAQWAPGQAANPGAVWLPFWKRKGGLLRLPARRVLIGLSATGRALAWRMVLNEDQTQLPAWLEAQPASSAVDVPERLRVLHPDWFRADHLRTVQRFMEVRRATMAREVLFGPLLPTAAGEFCNSEMLGNIPF